MMRNNESKEETEDALLRKVRWLIVNWKEEEVRRNEVQLDTNSRAVVGKVRAKIVSFQCTW